MSGKSNERFVVSKENWTLHRKGDQDQRRHMEKVKKAIQSNLPDLISEESIIMSGGKETIKIPIRSLDEYKIRYNHDKTQHVGQGDGESQIGDVVGSDGSEGESGSGPKAGNLPGQDYYETEVSISEIETTLFEELELPNLEQKDLAELTAEHVEFNDIRKIGLTGNIDKKQTLLSAFKRNAMEGKAEIMPISKEDLRFKTWDEVNKPESQAVVLAMMDTSGSMGTIQKYIARSFFFWMTKFLHTNYKTVEIEFIAHHTEAKVVSEQDFFSKGESGGTICSSAYEKALELIEEKYNPTRYNIYPFHFSDGENMSSDNKKCLELVEKLMEFSNLFGYGEVNTFNRFSTLMSTYELIDNPKFKYYVLKGNEDVYHALKSFFPKNLEGVH